jgi:5-dehydro-2-deoxygluconokinase
LNIPAPLIGSPGARANDQSSGEYNQRLISRCVSSLHLTDKTIDLIAIGRSSVDLYGEQIGGRLEDMGSFAKYVGGSPTNTVIAAARLGLRAGLLTRVGADHMGRFIREELLREGVDVRGVHTDPERLTALVVLGIRNRESFPLIFYRENCADMALREADLDDAYLASARAVLINGTHLSAPGVFAASLGAARRVKANGGRVVFDVDYRPVLWGLTPKDLGENRFVSDAGVTARLQAALPWCDLIVGTEEELCILGGSEHLIAAIQNIRTQTRATLVCKRGARGCVAFAGDIPDDIESGLVVPGFKINVLNVLGAGDAFMGGFLRGWLRDETLEESCRMGNACGALVVSRHGCAPAMPTWPELQSLLRTAGELPQQSFTRHLDHVHWASTRAHDYPELMVLAIDHRSQFEDPGNFSAPDKDRIATFKTLGFRALDLVARQDRRFGVLLDGRYGFDALSEAADSPYWVGRPIEIPQSRPLEFEGSADVAVELLSWPLNQVVKCLVSYHPDDPVDLKGRQDRQLRRLFDACRKTRHELLLEIILPREMPSDDRTMSRALSQVYALDVRPDWWKLPPGGTAAHWQAIQDTITQEDPMCRGVLLLGLSQPETELIACFANAAPFRIVKGFAIGRTIFHDVARAWFAGSMSDADAVKAMAAKFSRLANAWRAAHTAVAI